eukprot:6014816-Alexandrium_andersonii.AAC.1
MCAAGNVPKQGSCAHARVRAHRYRRRRLGPRPQPWAFSFHGLSRALPLCTRGPQVSPTALALLRSEADPYCGALAAAGSGGGSRTAGRGGSPALKTME